MTEPTAFNLTDSILADETVDFYTLIGKTPDADAEDIRQRIQALYSEATANRDNRNLKKRREYQTLLELLPHARAALLESAKRARYDDFLAKAKAGNAPGDFETFINDLMGFNESMEENTGLLATKEDTRPRATVIEVPKSAAPAPKPSAPSRPAQSAPAPSRSVPSTPPASGGGNAYSTSGPKSSSGGPGGIIGGVGGLVLGGGIGYALFHQPIPAVLLGIVLAAVGFVALNGKVGK